MSLQTNGALCDPDEVAPRLAATRDAFDSVAPDYDGERGNNGAIQDMRREFWGWLDATFGAESRLLDIGCGTGLDAVRMAERGHRITAIDWSEGMVRRTRERVAQAGLGDRVHAHVLGAQQLDRLAESATYDGGYSNLGPLNCVPDLAEVSRQCGRLLRPGGHLVFSVIGRYCPWELGHYLLRRRWQRAQVRFAAGMVPVSLNKRVVWTRYYSPREFFAPFEPEFQLLHQRGLCLFVPPPYLVSVRERHPRMHALLWRMDRVCASWPLLRALGDHFLMVLRRR